MASHAWILILFKPALHRVALQRVEGEYIVVWVLQMSQRLLDLERALTVGTAVPNPAQEADRREEIGVLPRALSVGIMRKSSLSIRRTFNTFRHAPTCSYVAQHTWHLSKCHAVL